VEKNQKISGQYVLSTLELSGLFDYGHRCGCNAVCAVLKETSNRAQECDPAACARMDSGS
jgi:hypothetical protein